MTNLSASRRMAATTKPKTGDSRSDQPISVALLQSTPAVPLAPPRIEDERADPALRESVLAYTAPQDLVGLPACVLPNGLQLTGPPGAEALLVSVASSLAEE